VTDHVFDLHRFRGCCTPQQQFCQIMQEGACDDLIGIHVVAQAGKVAREVGRVPRAADDPESTVEGGWLGAQLLFESHESRVSRKKLFTRASSAHVQPL
jgi:hypothetical protein